MKDDSAYVKIHVLACFGFILLLAGMTVMGLWAGSSAGRDAGYRAGVNDALNNPGQFKQVQHTPEWEKQ